MTYVNLLPRNADEASDSEYIIIFVRQTWNAFEIHLDFTVQLMHSVLNEIHRRYQHIPGMNILLEVLMLQYAFKCKQINLKFIYFF